MTQPITQEQYDLIQLLIERGISREVRPLQERLSRLECGDKKQFEKIMGG